jgi:hypothetical protein
VAAVTRTNPGCRTITNFGQDSSFAGAKTSQNNADGNGYGDFFYTPPTGFNSLCTRNLPDPTVVPGEHFNVVTYTGTETARSIDVGFATDLLWIKTRGATYSHYWMDNVRGQGKRLFSSNTNAESYDSTAPTLTSTGFDLTTATGYNSNNVATVAWNWKAGTAASGSTTGSGTAKTYTASYNAKAGFSIVAYTGNGTVGQQIPHHLDSTPEIVIAKERSPDSTHNWRVAHTDIPTTHNLQLNANAGQLPGATDGNLAGGFISAMGSSTFTLAAGYAGSDAINGSDDTYIAYCFHSVEGYSKVGSYTGNGSTDGTFVYTGFRVSYVLIKAIGAVEPWMIMDVAREPTNLNDAQLQASATNAETQDGNGLDMLSNGFKLRSAIGNWGSNGISYMYVAFAETPFKYSNAR